MKIEIIMAFDKINDTDVEYSHKFIEVLRKR